ncbi:hypothetical protein [Nonomuraea sp. NPDC048916]|uniref:hypothetical protein n=1 Tax=Nonomuraea sp. NPDC048916 TaxID=3154232 RepID=UPI0033DBC8C9
MTNQPRPEDTSHEPIDHAWRFSSGAVRTSPEEFLALSGLAPEEQRLLRTRHGLAETSPR